jgi:hypothetical protein
MLEHVDIGHVGYIHDGRFKILFDAGRDLGERTRGADVPYDFFFNPLIAKEQRNPLVNPPRSPRTEFWGFERSAGVGGSLGGPT